MNNTQKQYNYMIEIERKALKLINRSIDKTTKELAQVTALAKAGNDRSYQRMLAVRLDLKKLQEEQARRSSTIAALQSEISRM